MKIMYRQVQELREHVWAPVTDLEARTDEAEAAAGHPLPLRLRMFAGAMKSQTRVQQRTYTSLSDWAARYEARQNDPLLARLDAERHELGLWQNDELYIADPSLSDTPAWAPLIDQVYREGRGRAAEAMDRMLNTPPTAPLDLGEPVQAVDSSLHETGAPLALMYRQVQEIRPGMWEQQFALERETDEVESGAGHPLPERFRALSSASVATQLRVHQRVYPSIAAWGQMFEEWTTHERMQELEIERHEFYTWEREELYYVELPGRRRIRWIEMAIQHEKRANVVREANLDRLAEGSA